MDILSGNYPGKAQKLVNVVIEMIVRKFDSNHGGSGFTVVEVKRRCNVCKES